MGAKGWHTLTGVPAASYLLCDSGVFPTSVLWLSTIVGVLSLGSVAAGVFFLVTTTYHNGGCENHNVTHCCLFPFYLFSD